MTDPRQTSFASYREDTAILSSTGDEPDRPIAERRQVAMRSLGRRLREARRGRYWVEALAERSSVSSGLISQIERGVGNPSVATLLKLCAALDLELGMLFDGDAVDEQRAVVREHQRRRLVMPRSGLVYELLTPEFGNDPMLFRTTLEPGFDNESDPAISLGRQAVHLLSGTIDAGVGAQVFRLTRGDTITYDGALPHWLRNRGRRPAHLIVYWAERRPLNSAQNGG